VAGFIRARKRTSVVSDNVIEFTIKAKDEFSSVFSKFHASIVGKMAEGISVAGAAVFGFTKAVSESEVHIATFAQAAGLSTEAMSELAHAAELSQSSLEEVGNGMKFMQRAMGEANQGNIQAMKAFRDLGFATKDASGHTKDASTSLRELGDRFNAIQDPAERTRLAMQVFGRSGQDMIKILSEGSEGLKRMAEDAKFLGVVLSEQAAANAKAFDDQTNRLTQSIKGASMAIANEWIPILTGLTRAIADTIASWREPLQAFAKGAIDAVLTAFVAIKQIAVGIYNFVVKAFSSAEGFDNFIENAKRAFMYLLNVAGLAMKSLGIVMFSAFKLIWESFVEVGKWAWQKVFDFVTGQNLADTLGEVLFKRIPEATQKTREELRGIFGDLKTEWADVGQKGSDLMTEMFGVSAASIKNEVDSLKQKFTEYGEVREQTDKNVSQQSVEQMYQQFLAQQKLAEEHLTAQIFYAQSIGQVWSETMDLIGVKALNMNQQFSSLIQTTFDQVTSGIGQAVAKAIVMGDNLGAALKQVMQQVLMSVIEMLVKMGIQRLILMAMNVTSTATEASASLSKGFADVWVNSFASAAAIPIYGWAIAPEVATANLGIAMAGAGGAMAAGKGMGALAGAAHGGMTNVPSESTFLLNEGERVLSPDQNKDLTSFLSSDRGGGVNVDTLVININGSDFDKMSSRISSASCRISFIPQ
jgi:phage host-nuclease inhibitor protein Gam